MNYTKDPLVIKPIREIPQEVMFSSSNKKQCSRDATKPNRLWFKYPEHWVHTSDKERIIGIRNCYIARTQRHIWFDIHITIETGGSPEPSTPGHGQAEGLDSSGAAGELSIKTIKRVIHIDSWLDADKTVKEFIIDLNKQMSAQLCDIKGTSFKESHLLMADSFYSDDKYVVVIRKIPWAPEKITIDELHYTDEGIDNDLMKLLSMKPFSNDDDTMLFFPFKWDRYHLYLTSSIADLDSEHFLSHTDRSYIPIKYYRVHSTDDKFWVDTYSTRDHSIPSVLPEDDNDVLMIEAVVCFDSSAMI